MHTSTSTIFKTLKKFLSLLLALLFLLSPALCQEASNMTLGIISVTSQYMNPLVPVEREFRSLQSLVYESLITIDDDYMPQPNLAERWESDDTCSTWYFYLREGVTFHDGSYLTAQDVVDTAKTILSIKDSTENPGAYASLQYFIKNISASDERTVVITTNRQNIAFLYAMTFPILPSSQVQAENPAGTGPYAVEKFNPKEFVILSANQNWWKGIPKVETVMGTFHTTNRDLMTSFEYNRVDAILTRSLNAAQYRGGTSSINLAVRTHQLETLQMNNTARELNDVRVRKAIRHAINVDELLSLAYLDMAQRANTPMLPGTWTYSDMPELFQFNPERAKALLDEAGWVDSNDDGIRDKMIDGKNANLVLRFLVYEEQDNSVRTLTANKITSMLQAVGIKCNVDLVSFETAKARLKARNYDLCLAAFNMDPVPDPGFLLMSRNTCNYTAYSSAEMDNLFSVLRTTTNQDTYRNVLFQIQSLFAEDCPFMCLYYRRGAILSRTLFTKVRDLREPEALKGIAEGL
jgi:peptide/nickel transport system substrate-binding protein